MSSIQDLIDRIDNAAALPQDPPRLRLAKTVLIFVGVFALGAGTSAALYFTSVGRPAAGMAAAAWVLLSGADLALLLFTKRLRAGGAAQLALLLAAPALVQAGAGGFVGSGGAVLWGLLSPLGALILAGTGPALYWFGAYAAVVLLSGLPDLLSGVLAPAAVQLFAVNFAVIAAVVFFALRHAITEREKAQAALEEEHRLLLAEQEKSERLLLNILPRPIAERLKLSGGTIADGFADVTVLFSDIVGFTPLSATLSPERLVELLNRLFSAFDRLAEKHGVEKIKTIGDAYMVCSGLPEPRTDHAQRAAAMAVDMAAELERFNRENGTAVSVRIGLNSGPVVAGVIGLKKFVYDLWGDTVNTASRMESHGVPGRIQASPSTWALLKDFYDFDERGEIQVKGLGSCRTYLLKGRKA